MDFSKYSQSVVVVDDEPFVLSTTAAVLGRAGFRHVLTADTAAAALQLIGRAEPPVGLALCDLNMPDMDGIELLRHLDEEGYRGDVLIFSGEDDHTLAMAENLARARSLSVIGSIAKPIQIDQLTALMVSNSKQAAPPARRPDASPITPTMLEEAIDGGELEPWFQPKIDVVSKEPVGVEALMRWPSKHHGMIYPDLFIPMAEKHGLIDRMTNLLIEKSVQWSNRWHAQGVDLKIAINVSMDSLHLLDFPDQVCRLIALGGSDCRRFQLEVTESRLMKDKLLPLDVLLRMRLKKINLSIDDFGTGHSNLAQLRDLPFDELKLDRSFIQGALSDVRAQTILHSSVEMAKSLGMRIVAEGVENLQGWKRVEQLGCDQVQGYFTARPMPGSEILKWMASWPERKRELFYGADRL